MRLIVLIFAIAPLVLTKPLQDREVAVRQDTLGNYKVEYNVDGISKTEQRTADGSVTGGYSYYDPNGMLRKIQYIAGENGFQVVGADLPIAPLPVQDTPEVALAKAEHLALLRAASTGQIIEPIMVPISSVPLPSSGFEIPLSQRSAFEHIPHQGFGTIPSEVPLPVQETPEVAAARAEHLRAHLEALSRL